MQGSVSSLDTGGTNRGDTDTAVTHNGPIYEGLAHTDVVNTGVGNNKGHRC